ncbi:tegument protein US24 [Human betaherpesvirus 5]|uniref:Tegument protein US24 n=1 Tax=Human cytomegalovirus TaxID=10359 RepID=V9LS44_HCMV|nr:tegument protein US24 [Human betaherpesvirus 5]APA46441.1 tegument protein US24 [Human betaherpesvirus 5]QBK84344.1 tegument protein US24 [Human betaherpesvirus 5]QIA45807.1 tegument protein US24 [Human betaherpesvirus 5]UNW44904.1 tegument protein US24 [Human betaherpesvirus 5]
MMDPAAGSGPDGAAVMPPELPALPVAAEDPMALYRQVLRDFKELFFCLEPMEITRYVHRNEGRCLSLGPPKGWHVMLRTEDGIITAAKQAASKLICCREPLTPLGYAVILLPEPRRDHHDGMVATPYVVFMGRFSRVYAYDTREKYMVLVSHNLDELARYGVSRSEIAYRDVIHTTLRRMTVPVPRRYPKGARTMHVLFLNDTTPEGSYATAERILGCDVKLHTPGYGTVIMRLMKTVQQLHRIWPFCALTEVESRRWWWAVRANLATPWYVLGVTGRPRPGRSFVAEVLVLLDWFGAVYAIQMDDPNHYVRRVANTITEFFRMGLLKMVFRHRRFERERQRQTRMEHRHLCPHHHERAVDHKRDILFNEDAALPDERRERERRILQQQYDWLCLTERFDPHEGAWERLDPNTLVLHRYDTNSQSYVLDPDIVGVETAEREAAGHQDDTGPRLHCLVTTRSSTREGAERVITALVHQSRLVTYSDPFPLKSLTGVREYIQI